MSLNKRLTSYHEAGHAIRAYFRRKQSLVTALITLTPVEGGGGTWDGSVGVNLDLIHPRRHVDIALAGLIAEARLSGIEHAATGGVAFLPDEQPALAQLLHDYYELERTPEDHHALERTPLQVERDDGTAVNVIAAVSFADLDEIPAEDRSVAKLSARITRLASFFNDDEHWFRVGLLADDLNDKDWPRHYDYIAFLQATMLQA